MVGCGHRGEDPSAHEGYDPVPPPCVGPKPDTVPIGVMRLVGDAGAGVTMLRIRPNVPGFELVEAPGRWTVVDGLVHLPVPADLMRVRVTFAKSYQPGCDVGRPVEYEIDVALVPSDRELPVRSR